MKVVKFYADWCGPCKSYQEHWDEVQNENDDSSIEFISVNIEEPGGAKYKRNLEITSIPLTVIFNEELEPQREHKGLLKPEQLKEFING